MIRAGLFACVAAALCAVQGPVRLSAQGTEVRALWVLRASLDSPDTIRRMVTSAAANGFNTLFVQVGSPQDAPAFDALGETLTLAHARGLRVHAWIDVTMVSAASEFPRSREHVIYQHPEWLMVPRELAAELLAIDPRSPEYLGRLARWSRNQGDRVAGVYVSPLHADAQVQLAASIRDLVTRYALDGVHLDHVTFPGADFDYSRGAIDRFKRQMQRELSADERARVDAVEQIDPFAYPNERPDEWRLFRQTQLSALVTRIYSSVKAARASVVVSAAVMPDAGLAQRERFQDWRTWAENGFVDVLCPMAYTADATEFTRQVAEARLLAGGRPVWAGIGAHRISAREAVDNIAAARRLGAAGVILFSYDSIVGPQNGTDYLSALARLFNGAL